MAIASHPLKILHLIYAIRETSGPYNEHCLPLAQERKITICTFFKSELIPPPEIRLFAGDGTLRGALRALKAALADREYDAIHAHGPHLGVLLLMAALFRRSVLARTVYTVQNSYRNYKLRNRLLLIPIFACFQRLVLCSRACLESLPWWLTWLGRGRMQVVQNAVDITRIERNVAAAAVPSGNDRFTIAIVGRVIEIKNPFAVLKAFHRANPKDGELVFVGEGNLRPQLTAEVKQLGLEQKVKMTGLVSRDAVFGHLANSDLLISTSRGEGLPVAVLEAMACGCPVVLSDIPPHREIAEGVDFIPLVDPDDIDGFARGITQFRKMSKLERDELGEKCKRLIDDRFGLGAMHRSLENVYGQVSVHGSSHVSHAAARVSLTGDIQTAAGNEPGCQI